MFTPRIFWRVESSADSAGSAMCTRHPSASEANAPLSVEDGCETAAASTNNAQGDTAYDKILVKLITQTWEMVYDFLGLLQHKTSNGSSNDR